MTVDQKREAIAEKLVAVGGDSVRLLLDQLFELGRQDGAEDLLIDLHNADEITDDAIDFAVTNNGVADPRR
jgi:hypothetical protein